MNTNANQSKQKKREKALSFFRKLTVPKTQVSPTIVPRSTSNLVATSSSASLWDKAFAQLRDEDANLVTKYEEKVGQFLDDASLDPTERESLERLIDIATRKSEAAFSVAGYTARDVLEKAAALSQWAKEWIDGAVKASPEASIAWSIISLGIPFLAYPAAAEKECKDGFSYTISRMKYYLKIEADVLALGTHFKSIIIDFYKTVLDYQIRSVLRFVSSTLSSYTRDILQLDKWKEKHATLVTKEQQLYQSSLQSSSLSIGNRLGRLESLAENEKNILQAFTGLTKDQLNVQTEIRDNTEKRVQQHDDYISRVDEKDRDKVLHLFRCSDGTETDHSYEKYKQRNAVRAEGTCLWLLDHTNFKAWTAQDSGPLFITADPGCGKSVLAAFLVDEVIQGPVCYFFFKDYVQCYLKQALCALLHQLFIKQRPLLDHAMEYYKEDGKSLFSNTQRLWRLFCDVLRGFGRVIIVLDALDECSKDDRAELMKYLQTYLPRTAAKFLLTSRPYEPITDKMNVLTMQFTNIHIPGEDLSDDISREINIVINCRVEQLAIEKQLSSEMRGHIEQELLKVKHRTYLWVHLVLEHLAEGFERTPNAVDETIRHLPKTVNEAYEQILRRSASPEQASTARIILSILLAAKRTLYLEECRTAVAVAKDPQCDHPNEAELENIDDFRKTIRRECGLLVAFQDDQIYFLHQTVREFLTGDSHNSQWQNSFDIKAANQLLTLICIRQLKDWHRLSSFMIYALEFWAAHFHNYQEARLYSEDIDQRVLRLCSPDLGFLKDWSKNYHRSIETTAFSSKLMILVALDFYHLARICVSDTDLNFHNSEGMTALHYALFKWRTRMAHELLEIGANVDLPTIDTQETALHMAVGVNDVALASKIISLSKKLDAQNYSGSTALHLLASGQIEIPLEEKVLSMMTDLLEHGANPNLPDCSQSSPVLLAAKRSGIPIVQKLLDHGASLQAVDSHGETIMHYAARGYNSEMIDFLAATLPDPHKADSFGRTPLHIAGGGSRPMMIESLLRNGARHDAQDSKGYIPLHYAVKSNLPKNVASLLLSPGDLYVNIRDHRGRSPIHLLQSPLIKHWYENDNVIIALYNGGADMSAQDSQGRSIIHLLMLKPKSGDTLISTRTLIRVLTSKGSNVNVSDHNGNTTMHTCFIRGLLADTSSDSDSDTYSTHGHKALGFCKGYNIVEALLAGGADAKAKNNVGQTPLDLARSCYLEMQKNTASGDDANDLIYAEKLIRALEDAQEEKEPIYEWGIPQWRAFGGTTKLIRRPKSFKHTKPGDMSKQQH